MRGSCNKCDIIMLQLYTAQKVTLRFVRFIPDFVAILPCMDSKWQRIYINSTKFCEPRMFQSHPKHRRGIETSCNIPGIKFLF